MNVNLKDAIRCTIISVLLSSLSFIASYFCSVRQINKKRKLDYDDARPSNGDFVKKLKPEIKDDVKRELKSEIFTKFDQDFKNVNRVRDELKTIINGVDDKCGKIDDAINRVENITEKVNNVENKIIETIDDFNVFKNVDYLNLKTNIDQLKNSIKPRELIDEIGKMNKEMNKVNEILNNVKNEIFDSDMKPTVVHALDYNKLKKEFDQINREKLNKIIEYVDRMMNDFDFEVFKNNVNEVSEKQTSTISEQVLLNNKLNELKVEIENYRENTIVKLKRSVEDLSKNVMVSEQTLNKLKDLDIENLTNSIIPKLIAIDLDNIMDVDFENLKKLNLKRIASFNFDSFEKTQSDNSTRIDRLDQSVSSIEYDLSHIRETAKKIEESTKSKDSLLKDFVKREDPLLKNVVHRDDELFDSLAKKEDIESIENAFMKKSDPILKNMVHRNDPILKNVVHKDDELFDSLAKKEDIESIKNAFLKRTDPILNNVVHRNDPILKNVVYRDDEMFDSLVKKDDIQSIENTFVKRTDPILKNVVHKDDPVLKNIVHEGDEVFNLLVKKEDMNSIEKSFVKRTDPILKNVVYKSDKVFDSLVKKEDVELIENTFIKRTDPILKNVLHKNDPILKNLVHNGDKLFDSLVKKEDIKEIENKFVKLTDPIFKNIMHKDDPILKNIVHKDDQILKNVVQKDDEIFNSLAKKEDLTSIKNAFVKRIDPVLKNVVNKDDSILKNVVYKDDPVLKNIAHKEDIKAIENAFVKRIDPIVKNVVNKDDSILKNIVYKDDPIVKNLVHKDDPIVKNLVHKDDPIVKNLVHKDDSILKNVIKKDDEIFNSLAKKEDIVSIENTFVKRTDPILKDILYKNDPTVVKYTDPVLNSLVRNDDKRLKNLVHSNDTEYRKLVNEFTAESAKFIKLSNFTSFYDFINRLLADQFVIGVVDPGCYEIHENVIIDLKGLKITLIGEHMNSCFVKFINGITFRNASKFSIENVGIISYERIQFEDCFNVSLKNCDFTTKSDCILFDVNSQIQLNGIYISNCIFASTNAVTVEIRNTNNITIKFCEFINQNRISKNKEKNVSTGLKVISQISDITTVQNCIFNQYNQCVHFNEVSCAIFSDNKFLQSDNCYFIHKCLSFKSVNDFLNYAGTAYKFSGSNNLIAEDSICEMLSKRDFNKNYLVSGSATVFATVISCEITHFSIKVIKNKENILVFNVSKSFVTTTKLPVKDFMRVRSTLKTYELSNAHDGYYYFKHQDDKTPPAPSITAPAPLTSTPIASTESDRPMMFSDYAPTPP